MNTLSEQVLSLISQQTQEWELAAQNYAALDQVRQRTIVFDGFNMQIQFNPQRIVSSSAKVDEQSIRARACFLCTENRSIQQQSIAYTPDYEILVNPYPISRKHLTIPATHIPQRIAKRVGDMLRLAYDLNDFTILYNGPKCGASAPDHFHFQAIGQGVMPIEWDFEERKNTLYHNKYSAIDTLEDIRKILIFTSPNAAWIETSCNQALSLLGKMQPTEDEAMVNLLAYYQQGNYTLFLFPRQKHRPDQYFETGNRQVIFSPASVDFGGLLIIPREEDYYKLTASLVADMFTQVSFGKIQWEELKQQLQQLL